MPGTFSNLFGAESADSQGPAQMPVSSLDQNDGGDGAHAQAVHDNPSGDDQGAAPADQGPTGPEAPSGDWLAPQSGGEGADSF